MVLERSQEFRFFSSISQEFFAGISVGQEVLYEINPYCEALDFFFDVSYYFPGRKNLLRL